MSAPRGLARWVDRGLTRGKRLFRPAWQRPAIALAAAHRSRLRDVARVGVTGSCGKTTTKDLLAAVLATRYPGTKSEDSNNGTYAVARTLLATSRRSGTCVVELGAAGPGSLDEPIRLLRPSMGIVTNVGSDHFSAFRGADGVAEEKGKLVAALRPDGVAVLNADDPRVLAMIGRCAGRVVTYGLSPAAGVRATDVRAAWPERLSFTVVASGVAASVQTRLCGAHWVHAALAALAAGESLGVPLAEGARALEAVEPWRGRMSPVETDDGVTFIRDEWKAPLWSVPAALEFVRTARAQRKVVVFGTISDTQGDARSRYREVAEQALDVADHVAFVGRWAGRARAARRPERLADLSTFGTVQQAAEHLRVFLRSGDLVLLKGSLPADHLERILLARRETVACWRTACGRRYFCDGCRLRTIASPPR
ncbi:MAG: Mur ligase family protein [Gemmatimonadota bacterium]